MKLPGTIVGVIVVVYLFLADVVSIIETEENDYKEPCNKGDEHFKGRAVGVVVVVVQAGGGVTMSCSFLATNPPAFH